jgi:hypothetical protein
MNSPFHDLNYQDHLSRRLTDKLGEKDVRWIITSYEMSHCCMMRIVNQVIYQISRSAVATI